jgi:hypothetical protein
MNTQPATSSNDIHQHHYWRKSTKGTQIRYEVRVLTVNVAKDVDGGLHEQAARLLLKRPKKNYINKVRVPTVYAAEGTHNQYDLSP